MKILQVCPRYHPDIGGVETHVREISERLVRRSFQVEVVCTDPSGALPKKEHLNGVEITRFPSLALHGTIFFSPGIRSYLSKNEYNIIHAHNYHALPAYHAAKAAKGNLVFTPHYHGKGSTAITNLLLAPYHLVGARIFRDAKKIICVSEYERKLVMRDFHIAESKISVIPNGIDLSGIQGAQPYEGYENLILYIGRLEKYKHIDLIIRAMQFLPEARFFIIGSGNQQEELLHLIKKLNLQDRVKLLGHVSDNEKYRWLKTSSLFVNLSDTEAFGITVLEAIAAGKPVIVNPESALGEFVGKFEGLGMFKPLEGQEEKSAKILSDTIQENMSRCIHADVSGYDWNEIVKNIEREYLIIGGSGL